MPLNIDVPDLATAERLYVEAFGPRVGRRFGTDFLEILGWPVSLYLDLSDDRFDVGEGAPGRSFSGS